MTGYGNNQVYTKTRLASMGKVFTRLHRNVGKFVSFTREAQAKWPETHIKPIGDANNPQMSGAIIEAYRDTASAEGGDQITAPVLGHLSKPPYGDTEIEGLGEQVPIYERKLALTIFRKPIRLMTKMAEQRAPARIVNAINDYRSWLYDYWAYYWDGNIQHALCTGYDALLTNYRQIDGQRSFAEPFSPPNFAVAGSGRISYDAPGSGRPTTAAFESYLRSQLASIINDPTKGLTTERVLWAQQDAHDIGIPRWKSPWGTDYTLWFIDAWAAYQLKQDPDFVNEYNMAFMGQGKNSPRIHGELLAWEGNMFFVVDGMFGVKHSGVDVPAVDSARSSLGMPQYGPDGFWISDTGAAERLDRNSIKLNMIVGPGALLKLYGKKGFTFTPQTGDFEARQEWALETFVNLVRGDIFDPNNHGGNGANAYWGNQSLYTMATWSPRVSMP